MISMTNYVFITEFLLSMKHKISVYRWTMSQRMTDCAQNSAWQSVTGIQCLLSHLLNKIKKKKKSFLH